MLGRLFCRHPFMILIVKNVKVMLSGVKAIVARFEGACGYLLMNLFVIGDFAALTLLLSWLIEKQNAGWQMANSVQRLAEMKSFINKELDEWGCRARQNSIIIRTDGTLAPCLPMCSTNYDWGTIKAPRMEA